MTSLDAERIRRSLGEADLAGLSDLEVFSEIGSTNSYLMQQSGPEPGHYRVAVSDNQTAGRGRQGRTWQSPPGSGLCLSMAYTFARSPNDLPALTLAIGVGVIDRLSDIGIGNVQLKWPNDLIAMDGKLGGILTEAQTRPNGAVTVVTGVGINVDLPEPLDLGLETDWALHVVDLRTHAGEVPSRNALAACLMGGLRQTLASYEDSGFSAFVDRWAGYDWLHGRDVTIDTPQRQVTGVGAGVATDGALLVDTGTDGTQRITTGSVVMAGTRERVS